MLCRAARTKASSNSNLSKGGLYNRQLRWPCVNHAIVSFKDVQARAIATSLSSSPSTGPREANAHVATTQYRASSTAQIQVHRPIDDVPFVDSLRAVQSDGADDGRPYVQPALSTVNLRPPLFISTRDKSHERTKIRMDKNGVGGELSEILSILDTCIRIDQLPRAGVIIKRLAQIGVLDSANMMSWHNRYIEACVNKIMGEPEPQSEPSQSSIQSLQQWFEVEIRDKGLRETDETIAYMLKATLKLASPRERNLSLERLLALKSKDGQSKITDLGILDPEEEFQLGWSTLSNSIGEAQNMELLVPEDAKPDKIEDWHKHNDLPKVEATDQKGLGLKTLKKSLERFVTIDDSRWRLEDLEQLTLKEQREMQAQLEQDAVNSAVARWRDENSQLKKMGVDTTLQTKSLGARMWAWQCDFQRQVKEELRKCDESESRSKKTEEDYIRCQYSPFLRRLEPEKMAAITILTYMSFLSLVGADKGVPLVRSTLKISDSVEDECIFEALQRERKANLEKMQAADKSRVAVALRRRKAISYPQASTNTTNNSYVDMDNLEASTQGGWPSAVKSRLGAALLSILIDVAKIPVTIVFPNTEEQVTQIQPAFSHSYQYKAGKRIGIIQPNKALVDQLTREPVHSLLAKHLPMIVRPDPWTEFGKGGYVSQPGKMMRIKLNDKEQRLYAEAAIARGDMTQMFKGLDTLGKTSWRINRPLFKVMLDAWNSKTAIAKIPPADPIVEIPPEPAASENPLERRRWIQAVKAAENHKSGLHSQRCFQNFQLEIARSLCNKTFYFPHNVDFRGRAYPMPAYLNHMGADHCRALLVFGKGKELGDNGLKWLKIHLANVYGYDKASFKEREAFAMDNLAEVYDSASAPLTGRRWWLKAEDPWQCLGACMEIRDALDSPEPTRFISHLPIHQDGTCNGLQHYAALGGDVWGARQVNLEPGDRPADVYTAVADLVGESITADLETGNVYAKILDGKITRKIVKPTVMTNVYGVTFVGAKEQIKKQLIAAYPDLPKDERINPFILSSYVATKVFNALSTMFRGAHQIQHWFGRCASRICDSVTLEQLELLKAHSLQENTPGLGDRKTNAEQLVDIGRFKSTVIWTTPLNMPVVQPYRIPKSREIATALQSIQLQEPRRSDVISKRKQLQAFPPNFIHSLDATHMILSAIRCDELNLSFAAVHDSFWTHASDVDVMNNILRDAFVRLHSEDVIGRLAAEFSARYKGSMYLQKIKMGTKLSRKIVDARKTLRMETQEKGVRRVKASLRMDELLLEWERHKLLASSDPKEVEKAKAMVTPAKVFEEMGGEAESAAADELKDIVKIGDMNDEDVASQEPGFDEPNADLAVGENDEGSLDPDRSDVEDADDLTPEDSEHGGDEKEDATCFERSLSNVKDRSTKYTWVWLPWSLPLVPKKGAFDVTRLKLSPYFFS